MSQTEQNDNPGREREDDFDVDGEFSEAYVEDIDTFDDDSRLQTDKKKEARDLHKIRRSIEDHLERKRLREMQDLPFDDDFDFDFDEDDGK